MSEPPAPATGTVESTTPADAPAAQPSAGEDAGLAAVSAAPELLANSLGEYLHASRQRIRTGDSGALPIVVGLIVVVVFFQIERSQFLSSLNVVNLLVQAAFFVLFGAAEIFALVLSEIDLSVGFVAGVAGFTIAELIAHPVEFPWWLGILCGFAVAGTIGVLQGTLITRLRLPSFVVTLGGLLLWEGVMLELASIDKTAVGGVISISESSPVYKLVNANMSPALGWIVLVVALASFALLTLTRAARRRAKGLSAPPLSIALLTIAITAIAGVALVYVCNRNRGLLIPLRGVPWVVPFVGVVLFAWSVLLGRTRLGRYIYAIGANPEAARRAGINVARVRTLGFMLASLTAGMAGLVYESRLGSMATDIDGGSLVLYAVAAAVIGGASLFGGRGKPLHALLGGVLIAAVFNGLGLMGISAAGQDIATAIVLVVAATVDSTLRRRGATGAT
jgi:D-xylose transport system permease protein